MQELTMPFRRTLLAALTAASTIAAGSTLATILPPGGILVFDVLFVAIFALLFAWVSQAFWTASFGFLSLIGRRRAVIAPPPAQPAGEAVPSRTAVVMPIYNEDPARVIAGLRAMYESLAGTGQLERFDFYLLSDSNDPDVWIEEERAWWELVRAVGGNGRIFYRNRFENRGRKAGNIAEFLTRWGSLYDYMIVLDADSIMAGETLVEMVRRMDESPKAAIIQVPSLPVNRESLFARIAQFGSSVYGPVYAAGMNWWQGVDGNYYGHNAVLRVAAFVRHCGLPTLPGKAPLGGEIHSHDFVEAALLRRAGWEVLLADDLGGSYEEVPPTLIDYAKRDRRWCQGNLQHGRILAAQGLTAASRAHLAMGVMSYLSSPLWLLLLIISGIEAVWRAQTPPVYFTADSPFPVWPVSHHDSFVLMFTVTAAFLFIPKFYGLALLFRDRTALRQHGGPLGAVASVALESLFSVLLAPIMMLFQSGFVFTALIGRTVQWAKQRRDDGQTDVVVALVTHGGHTLFGLAVGAVAYVYAPGFFWWVAPVLAGLVLSVPLSMWSSRVDLGRVLRRMGLLLTPSETAPEPVLVATQRYIEPREKGYRVAGKLESPFVRAFIDPVVNALHISLLPLRSKTEAEKQRLRGLILKMLAEGAEALTRQEKRTLLQDRASVALLHRLLWARRRPFSGTAEPPLPHAA
jgi:membrane glycosyltransferase